MHRERFKSDPEVLNNMQLVTYFVNTLHEIQLIEFYILNTLIQMDLLMYDRWRTRRQGDLRNAAWI